MAGPCPSVLSSVHITELFLGRERDDKYSSGHFCSHPGFVAWFGLNLKCNLEPVLKPGEFCEQLWDVTCSMCAF